MRKYLLGSLFSLFVASSVFSAPSLVNGIAFFVNGNPVTLLDVYKVQQRDKVEQNIAVDILINEKLHEEEIKKHNAAYMKEMNEFIISEYKRFLEA